MKTTLKILLALLTMMAVWSGCEYNETGENYNIVNAVLCAISIPALILGYIFSTIYDSEDERAD